MAWTNPITFTPGQVVTATDLNLNIRDNELYLLAGRPAGFVVRQGTADYSTTSASFVDVDAANLILTLTLSGSRVLVIAHALINASLSAGACYLDWIVDSSARAGGTGGVANNAISGGGTQIHGVTAIGLFSGLAPGAHTFKLQFRGNGTGTAFILNNGPIITLLGLEV